MKSTTSSAVVIPIGASEMQVPAVKNSHRSDKDSRKQAVSIRMNRGDVRNIKRLAERLGARDSDVIRFAIKLMLGKLALLQDPEIRGRNLVPVFIEAGPELMRHFELDSARLSSIINEGAEPGRSVDPDDIQLIAMNGLQRSYIKYRMAGLRRAQNGAPRTKGVADGGEYRQEFAGGEDDSFERSLRQYLYEKYLHSTHADAHSRIDNTGDET